MSDSDTAAASPWQRISQRKLAQWALAYLAGAWLVLQLVELLAGVYGWPQQFLRIVTGLLALGLPVVLVLGWYHGERGEQRVTRAELSILTLLLFLGGTLLWWMERDRIEDAPAAQSAPSAAVPAQAAQAAPTRSIAVLPFVNMSADPANEYFSDGLSETLLDMLAQVPDLMVAARTSSFAFKGKAQDVRGIAAQLGVAHMLEGSVQKSGDQVRITAQLIKAADGSHLWSKRFDRRLDDVFRIQDEIATEVVAALKIALGERAQQHLTQRRTDNVEAYEEYLKGIALLPRRKVSELKQALAHFERAITLDPAFAQAYVGAADSTVLLREYGTVTPEQRARIRPWIDRALVLAPELGEAHASLAGTLRATRDYAGAEREFRRAIELAPSYASAYHWYGLMLLEELGRYEDALAQYRKATTLDPLAPVFQLNLSSALDASGRMDEAETILARLVEMHPDYPQSHWLRGLIAAHKGDLVGALTSFREHARRDPEAVAYGLQRCFVLAQFDALPAAQSCTARFIRSAPTNTDVVEMQIELSLLAGDTAAAAALLDRADAEQTHIRANQLMRVGRATEALALYRTLAPDLFTVPLPKLVVFFGVAEALEIGALLLQSGEDQHGRNLIEHALKGVGDPSSSTFAAATRWCDVIGLTLLGELEQAHQALSRGVERGEFLGLPWLDRDPLLAPLRADPRYERTLAPARARASEQVRLAREAGLLENGESGDAQVR